MSALSGKMMDELDEQHELIKACQAGDQKAIASLVTQHAQAVYGFLLYLCGDRYRAEDMSQETFLRALQALNKYQFRAPFRSWLFRIAINIFRDERRRATVRKWIDNDVSDLENYPLVHPEPGPVEEVEKEERVQELYKALKRLPPSLRMLIVLRDLQEMSYNEIAAAMDWRMGTVKSRLFRARQELAALLRPYWEDEI